MGAPASNDTSPAATPSANDANGTAAAPTASNFKFEFDKLSIPSSGAEKRTLTVTALDANNNVVAGVPVTVKVEYAIFTPTGKVTNAEGVYSGTIAIGQDQSIGNIVVTITVDGVVKTGYLSVTGG